MTRYAQKLLRRMTAERSSELLRPTLPYYSAGVVDPFEQVTPVLETPTPTSLQVSARQPAPVSGAELPHVAAPDSDTGTVDSSVSEPALPIPLPPYSSPDAEAVASARVLSDRSAPARPTVVTPDPSRKRSSVKPPAIGMLQSRPDRMGITPEATTTAHIQEPSEPERVMRTRGEPGAHDTDSHRAPIAPVPAMKLSVTPDAEHSQARDTTPAATELRPTAPPAPAPPSPAPNEPRVVIGRLMVEVVPESGAKSVSSPASLSRRRAASPPIQSGPMTPRSKLRFGLGQM